MSFRFSLVVLLLGCASLVQAQVRIEPQSSGVDARLRGISAVNGQVAWASGRQGTVLRTGDAGASWQNVSVPDANDLDFRDVEGFDAEHAVVLSIGNGAASRVYRTANGGRNWILVLQNRDERAFLDCMVFEGERGWILGDAVDGRFQVHATTDGGRHWNLLPDGPEAVEGEAAFAASGTCIARAAGTLLVASGGSSRLHALRDGDTQWRTVDSGMGRGKPEAGVFGVAPLRSGALLVGGDYKAETAPGNAAQWRSGAAVSEPTRDLPAPRGFRSGVACLEQEPLRCVVVGPAGVDGWNGEAWNVVSETGYDAVDLAGDQGWASGDKGRIGRVRFDR